ncbi:MAG: MlaD family protein [Pseudomonadota bacterium]
MTEFKNGIDNMDDMPEAIIHQRTRQISFVWIIPLAALIIGAWLVVKTFTEKGPTITIAFTSAEGIEAGKTKIKYKDVEVGKITKIDLSPDLSQVILTAEMQKTVKRFLSVNTRFWVVRARVAAREISGLSTLFSGAYIGLDPGEPGEPGEHYIGLDTPPVITSHLEGRQFILVAERLGSIDIGSPVYFRQIAVGRVIGFSLDLKRQNILVKVFINAPYHSLVKENSRFWNASGVDFSLDATGVRLATESLVSMVIGGVAFDTPVNFGSDAPAKEGDIFTLYSGKSQIFEETYEYKKLWLLQFDGSVRGLSVGAPVELRGIRLGKVLDINVEFSPKGQGIHVNVLIETEPQRVGAPMLADDDFHQLMDQWVAQGMRAQLKTGNLITGHLYVEIDFHPNAPTAVIDWAGRYPRLPTLPGNLEIITASVTNLLDKMSNLPIQEIGRDLRNMAQGMSALVNSDEMRQALTDLSHTMKETKILAASLNQNLPPAVDKANGILEDIRKLSNHLNDKVVPAVDETLKHAQTAMTGVAGTVGPDSQTMRQLNRALVELAEAAKAFRGLADYLERHPDALIYGKGEK